MQVEQDIVRVGDDVTRRVNRQQQVFFLALLGAYVALSLRVASARLFWFDELFTFYSARFTSLVGLWEYLKTGPELNPPVHYLVGHASMALFGANELALRLPSIVGYGVLVWCVHRFVTLRWGPLQGWLAALFVMASDITYYSYEARPYGLALGLAGIALLCWQRATNQQKGRAPALVGLAFTLGLGLSTHYYFLLMFIPLGLAELVRTAPERRLDLPLWGALLAGLLPLALYYPLISYARDCSRNFWAQPTWEAVEWSYANYLNRLILPGALTLGILAFPGKRTIVPEEAESAPREGPRPFEITAIVALAALPVFAILLGKLATGAYTPRYAIFAIPGLAILFSFAVVRLAVQPGRALNVVLIFFAWFVFVEQRDYCDVRANARSFADTCTFLRGQTGEMPVAYANYHFFLQVSHYDPVLAAHAVCIASMELPLRHDTHYTDDGALTKLARTVPLHVEDYEAFTSGHNRFLLFGENPWLHKELLERGARLTLLADRPEGKLFQVEIYPTATLAEVTNSRALRRTANP